MVTLLIVAVLAIGFVVGLRRGLILQLVHLASLVIALVVAKLYYKDLGPKLEMWVPFPSSADTDSSLNMLFNITDLDSAFYNAIAFFIIFIAVKIALQLIGCMLDFLAQLPLLKQFNQLAGGALGFIEVYLGVFIVIFIAAMLPIESLQDMIQSSSLAETIILDTPFLSDWVTKLWFHPFT